MKILTRYILFGITVCLVSSKYIVKRDCCTSCSCNSGYSNCNSGSCNYEYSDCNSRSSCNNRPNCNQRNQPCNNNNNNKEEPVSDEVLPVLVPFPQNNSTLPIASPTTINNTNINNATMEFKLTNSINTVNNISIPISVNSTNQNTIFVRFEKRKEVEQTEQSIEEIEEPQCCYVVRKKCDANNVCTTDRRKECSDICQGILPEVNIPEPQPVQPAQPVQPKQPVQPEQPVQPVRPTVNNTIIYQPPVNVIQQIPTQQRPFQSYPVQQFPYQPFLPFQYPCSVNPGSSGCSQYQSAYSTAFQHLLNYNRPVYQPTPVQQFPFQQLPSIQSPCSMKPQSSPCDQYPLPPTATQPLPQTLIQQVQTPPGFMQPSRQSTVPCANQGQQIQPYPSFPTISPCGASQANTNFFPNYPCSYQYLSKQFPFLYINCSVPYVDQASFYQQNVPFQQLNYVYGRPQQLQRSSQPENQHEMLQRLLTTLQQQPQLAQNQPLQTGSYQNNLYYPNGIASN